MEEQIINTSNSLSFLFLLSTLIILLIIRKKKKEVPEANLFYIVSFLLLFLVCITNLAEHFGKKAALDVYEDSLELLFIPFFIFALYANRLTNENKLREKAENFSSKILSTSPAITYIYNLEQNKYTYSSRNQPIKFNNNEDIEFFKDSITHDNSIQIKSHFEEIKTNRVKEFPIIFEFELSKPNTQNIYYQTHEIIFSSNKIGKPCEILGVAINITDQKIAEEKLYNYQNHLENLVKERTIELENSNCELLTINEQLHDKNEQLIKLNEISKEQSAKIETLNYDLLRQNETLENANQQLIKKQKELENTMNKLSEIQSQLIQSEKLSSLGVLLAGIAHEINNPMNYISNGVLGLKKALNKIQEFINAIMNSDFQNKSIDTKEYCSALIDKYEILINMEAVVLISSHIQTGINRILDIIASLTQYTRSGYETYENIDLHKIIDSVLVMLFHEYKNRLEITKKYNKLPLVECKQGKINQVLMNLISNAIQSIPNKGEIKIETYYDKARKIVKILISDTGEGIPVDIKNKIFDPFFTTKKAGKGTGLGLSISYDIIQSHGGSLTFSSSDSGTTFSISLPIKRIEDYKNLNYEN